MGVPPPTAWVEQRETLLAAIRAVPMEGSWPAGYLIRRVAWHVRDHTWEIADRRS